MSQNIMATSPPPLSPLILLDGGLGTTLTGPPYNVTFLPSEKPLWSSHLLLSPSSLTTLLSAQTAFAEAGADVILTDTYQASFEGFALSGVSDEGEAGRLMRGGVSVARAAFDEAKTTGRVALSLGPYGAIMVPAQEYTGRYDEGHQSVRQLRDWHLRRLSAFVPVAAPAVGDADAVEVEVDEVTREKGLCWAEVDLVAFETVPLLREVQAIREVMGSVSQSRPGGGEGVKKPFWIACVFPGSSNSLPDGSSVREVVRAILEEKEGSAVPMGIGLNCTRVTKVEALIEEFEEAVKEMGLEAKEWPSLVVYPDGTNGEVYNTVTKTWEVREEGIELSWDEAVFNIVSRVRERRLWKEVFVGGCCKTTPVEIGKLRKRIDGA